jgi:Rhodanese-like domain.
MGREARAAVQTGEVNMAVIRQWPRVLWIDARSEEAFDTAHWPGSVNLSFQAWETQIGSFMHRWTPGDRIVVYCDDASCASSEEVARRLRQEYDLPEVYVLKAGWHVLAKEMQP